MKRFLVLGVFVCLVSCIAETSDPSVMEDAAETQDELKITSFPPIDLSEREAVLEKSLTGWRVYIHGQDYHADKSKILSSGRRSSAAKVACPASPPLHWRPLASPLRVQPVRTRFAATSPRTSASTKEALT
jgi:hypothetical protein